MASASALGRIFCTRDDNVNCADYFHIGACRRGVACPLRHLDPLESQTLLIEHMFRENPNDENIFEDFVEDIYGVLSEFGPIYEIYICVNRAPHLAGHTYVQYYNHESAGSAFGNINGRYFAGRHLVAKLTYMEDIFEARCRDHFNGGPCTFRACKYLHVKQISPVLRARLNWNFM